MLTLLALTAGTPIVHAGYVADELKEAREEAKWHPSTKPRRFFDQTGVVQISGVVDLPVYKVWDKDPRPYIEIEGADGKKKLMLVDPYSRISLVTADFAKANGGKPKTRNIGRVLEKDVATIGGFKAGEVTFDGLHVLVTDHGKELETEGPIPVVGVLGLAGLPELSFALLNSQGVLRLAPAADAGTLTSSIEGGTSMPFTLDTVDVIKLGSAHFITGSDLMVQGTAAGAEVTVMLTSINSGGYAPRAAGRVMRDVVEGMPPVRKPGVQGTYVVPLTVGGVDAGSLPLMELGFDEMYPIPFDVVLGDQTTARWDVALDPAGTLVVAPGKAIKRASWLDVYVGQVKEGLEPDEESGEPPTPDAQAGVNSKLAKIYTDAGDYAAALAAAQQVVETKGDECASHLALARVYMHQGEYAKAKAPLEQATTLYEPWIALDLFERADIEQKKAKADKKEQAWEGEFIPQDHACARAWGYQAEVALVTGDFATVERLYGERRTLPTDASRAVSHLEAPAETLFLYQLEPRVAQLAGMAYLAQGDTTKANEAFLQYKRLSGGTTAAAGLAAVQMARGQQDQALDNYERSAWGRSDSTTLVNTRAWSDAIATAKGEEARLAAMKALAEADAWNPYWALVYAEALQASGQDFAAPLARALEQFEANLVPFGQNPDLLAGYAAALRLAGKPDDARKQAEKALSEHPREAVALQVLADLARDAGDAAAAAELDKKAAQAGTYHPVFAAGLAAQ